MTSLSVYLKLRVYLGGVGVRLYMRWPRSNGEVAIRREGGCLKFAGRLLAQGAA